MKVKTSIAITLILICLPILYFFIGNERSTDELVYEYDMEWVEEFNLSRVDTSKWSFMARRESDAGRYFSKSSEVFEIRRNFLRLYARKNDGIVRDDTASVLTVGFETFRKQTIDYGKVEVCARIRGAQGAWPAIWLRGEDERYSTYPDYAEIDIMEHLNYEKKVYQTVHTNYTDILKYRKHPEYSVEVSVDPSKYNVYAVEILPDRIIFSVNGRKTLTYPKIETNEYGQFPFGCPMHLMIDMQYGGEWVGVSDVSTLPAYMDIDWVKFYKLRK